MAVLAATAIAGLCGFSGCRTQSGRDVTKADAAPAVPAQFEDVSQQAGLRFTHHTGADGRYLMPESVGPGGALFDYDGDGWLDVFLVNACNWPDRKPAATTPALYRNQGDGTFRDVTRQAGLAQSLYGMGCAVADYDNDGHRDLLVTCLGVNRLYRNLGDGTFRDVTKGSGLDRVGQWDWHTSAAWFDYDRDGQLDLVVCRYVKWRPDLDAVCQSGSGKRIYCGPNQYGGDRLALYRNLGKGKFKEVSAAMGLAKAEVKALGVVPFDDDGDGTLDLFIANDTVPNLLYRNRGARFEEAGQEAGVAVSDTGRARAGMGADIADVRNDGSLAISVGNFAEEGLALFQRGQLLYTDVASTQGLTTSSLDRVTFGLTFLDADRDGWQDLFAYNGHIDAHIGEKGGSATYRQRPLLFRNNRGSFVDVTDTAGPPFQQPQLGRGCAWGDVDNDGRPDLLLCENSGPARLLKNVTRDGNHWLGVRLRGTPGNRDGYGAEVRVTSGGVTQRRWVRSGGSYLSHSDTRALFGLGPATKADRVEVKWLSGKVSVLEGVAPDRYLEVSE